MTYLGSCSIKFCNCQAISKSKIVKNNWEIKGTRSQKLSARPPSSACPAWEERKAGEGEGLKEGAQPTEKWTGKGAGWVHYVVLYIMVRTLYIMVRRLWRGPVWPEDFFSNRQSEVSKSQKIDNVFKKIILTCQNFGPKSPLKPSLVQVYYFMKTSYIE